MKKYLTLARQTEARLLEKLENRAFDFLRISIGLIYIVFGVLKFFPTYSPAEALAGDTIELLTGGGITGSTALIMLALLETGLGIMLLLTGRIRLVLILTVAHLLCTFIPMFFLPEYTYVDQPFSFSIVGQYILKNVIILGALFVLYIHYARKRQKVQSAEV